VQTDGREASAWAELDAIRSLGARIGAPPAGEVWVGDDMAVLGATHTLLFATDVSVEGVHFTRATGDLADAGWKALASNLSDVAAMGATPCAAVVGVVGAARADLDAIYDGILACSEAFDCPIVGGDLSAGPAVMISIAIVADAPAGPPVLRSGGRAGDQLFVTRPTGRAAAGLRALRGDLKAEGEEVLAHRRPIPRLGEGRAARRGGATAMIDVSDGLGLDLDRLCRASGVGARLDAVPVARGATIEEAMSGGEDYELLFSAASGPEVVAAFASAGLQAPIAIGALVEDADTRKIGDQDFVPSGYVHRLG
jgi:thiamine-monophosphate kinase